MVSVAASIPVRVDRTTPRIVWGIVGLGCLAVLITARMLTPSPSGFGTHTQLGLPPCGFLAFTGLPCPGCGLTTSFAHLAHFHVFDSLRANPFGLPLFLLTVVLVPASAVGFLRASPIGDSLDRVRTDRIALVLIATDVLVWVVRVVTILAT